jgi:uncharacterized protein
MTGTEISKPRVAMLFAGLAVACAASAIQTRPVEARQFDCRNAALASERMICRSDALGGLDERMSNLYSELMQTYDSKSQRDQLKRYQRQFLAARDSCLRDTVCIKGAYLDQISVLKAQLERTYRSGER